MTQGLRGSLGGRVSAGAALLASVVTGAAFLLPAAVAGTGIATVPEAGAQAVAGTDCSAVLTGTALDRAGWVASTNAPSSSTDAPANALDGNLATRFSTDEPQQSGLFFEVNMGSPQTFDELDMEVPNSPTDYARSFEVFVSDNASNWTTVATCTGASTSEVVSLPAQTAQYVLVYLTSSATYWWSIDEFNLYASAAPTTATAPTPPHHQRRPFRCVGRAHLWCCPGWGRYPVATRCCTGPQPEGLGCCLRAGHSEKMVVCMGATPGRGTASDLGSSGLGRHGKVYPGPIPKVVTQR